MKRKVKKKKVKKFKFNQKEINFTCISEEGKIVPNLGSITSIPTHTLEEFNQLPNRPELFILKLSPGDDISNILSDYFGIVLNGVISVGEGVSVKEKTIYLFERLRIREGFIIGELEQKHGKYPQIPSKASVWASHQCLEGLPIYEKEIIQRIGKGIEVSILMIHGNYYERFYNEFEFYILKNLYHKERNYFEYATELPHEELKRVPNLFCEIGNCLLHAWKIMPKMKVKDSKSEFDCLLIRAGTLQYMFGNKYKYISSGLKEILLIAGNLKCELVSCEKENQNYRCIKCISNQPESELLSESQIKQHYQYVFKFETVNIIRENNNYLLKSGDNKYEITSGGVNILENIVNALGAKHLGKIKFKMIYAL